MADSPAAESSTRNPKRLAETSTGLEDAKRARTQAAPFDKDVASEGSQSKNTRDESGARKPPNRKKKDKSAKYTGRRRGTRPEDESGDAQDEGDGEKQPRLPKRQCALLIGYCGTGCNGMQIQPDVRTIEGVLFDALVKAGAVSQDNADNPVKVSLHRAARTDAGVHAAGNLVSIKMITVVPGIPDIVTRINEELPPEIRLWSFVRVQRSFNARTSCDSRKYTYFFPTYLMIPPKPGSGLFRTFNQQNTSSTTASASMSDPPQSPHLFWQDSDPSSSPEEDIRRKKRWRISAGELAALRAVVQKYEWTHNFHNFTVGRDFKDRSCQRHMKKIEVADPAIYGDTEWISVMIHGQSFMLHQRKMMFVSVMSCRTGTPPQIIEELYGPRVVMVPKMPSLGLLLEYPIFDSYNNRIADANAKLEPFNVDFRPTIDFEQHRETIEAFKQEHIYSRMRNSEERSQIFDRWIRSVDNYAGPDLLYLNSQGIIPEAAVIKKDEKRSNAFREKKWFDATDFPTEVTGTGLADGVGEGADDTDEEDAIDAAKLAEMEG